MGMLESLKRLRMGKTSGGKGDVEINQKTLCASRFATSSSTIATIKLN